MANNPNAANQLVPLPADFFTRVMPQITSMLELKVTLHLFALVTRQTSRPRRVSWDTLVTDEILVQSLQVVAVHARASDLLAEGLGLAVQRGTIMHVVRSDAHGRAINWYLVHTAANLAWAQRHEVIAEPEPATELLPVPTIVAVYEQHIGVVTPMILAELQRAEAQYPATWVPDAIREAVLANVRSWRYIAKILARWSKDGRGDATPVTPGMEIDVTRYTDGAYGDLFRRGSDISDLEPLP